ncbi:MAG: hypothetical protein WEG36_07530 [Gemmatimonadota bacterium]
MSGSTESRVWVAVKAAFHQIAPVVDFDRLDSGADLRDEADLDSVDIVNLVVLPSCFGFDPALTHRR